MQEMPGAYIPEELRDEDENQYVAPGDLIHEPDYYYENSEEKEPRCGDAGSFEVYSAGAWAARRRPMVENKIRQVEINLCNMKNVCNLVQT